MEGISRWWDSNEQILEKYPCRNLDHHLVGLKEEVKQYAYQLPSNIPIKKYKTEHFPMTPEEKNITSIAIGKYVITVFLTSLIRSKHSSFVPNYVDLCKAYLNKHNELSQWFIQQFTNTKIIAEFLLECENTFMRRLIVGLLYCSMLNVYNLEETAIENCDIDKSLILNFTHV